MKMCLPQRRLLRLLSLAVLVAVFVGAASEGWTQQYGPRLMPPNGPTVPPPAGNVVPPPAGNVAPPTGNVAPAENVAGPSPNESLAAASPPDTVVDVKVAGNKTVPLAKILPSIHTRTGRPYDNELVQEDVRRLYSTRQFADVRPTYQRVPGGRIVYFLLVERPVLTAVKYIGCHQIHMRTLKKECGLKVGDPADPSAVEEARHKIEELYHKRGYNNAMVWMLEGNKFEDRRAVFVIDEGVKQQVWNTSFVGNTIASGDRLRTQISTSRPVFWLFGGEFDRKKMDEDVEKVTDYYRALGFFRARVGRELTESPDGKWVTIQFVIDEGDRYKVRNVSVIGNKKYNNDELTGELKLKDNQFFNRGSMTADVRALQDKYGGVGYVFADVKPDLRFLEEPGQVDLVYNITEGDRYRVGKINIRIKGEYSHTQENTVRNRLFFKPGDIVDIRQIRASEVALKRSGLFEMNPAQGNAPKITFNAPDRDGITPEDDDRQQMAEKPENGRRPGARFRGQSPDGASCDRVLDLVLDCGRLVGSRQELPESNGPQNAPQSQRQPATYVNPAFVPERRQAVVGVSAMPVASGDSSDVVRKAQEYTAALSRAKVEERSRLQYLAPDDNWQGSSLPRNAAPGDCGAAVPAAPAGETRSGHSAGETPAPQPARRPVLQWTAPGAARQQTESDANLLQRTRDYSQYVSQAASQREPRERVILTQYTTGSTGSGRTNPDESLRWWAPSEAAAANAANPPTTNTAAAPPSGGNPPTTQAAPVTPSPKVGNDQWPRQGGPERVQTGPDGAFVPGPIFGESSPFRDGPPGGGGPPPRTLGIDIRTEETMTGRLMFGVGINSDAGLVGSIVLDEQNFDWSRLPTSWEDMRNATAWRGAGQRFRVEAMPGTQVQQYSVTFQEPYMFGTQVGMSLNGYYYNRIFTEYRDQRVGGRVGFNYSFTPALSAGVAYRGAKINITDPIDPLLPALAEVTGRDLALHGFQFSLSLDKRDSSFLATEGYLIEGSIEQVLGSFQYPRAQLDLRKYFTLYERPDGSGRHVLSLSGRGGYTGDNTPIYDRYYAGGFSTIRGFRYRGASPRELGPLTGQEIIVGGNFELFASAEYMFPITADDMIRGVVFCDTGTVEPTINNWSNKYRVAPGFGLRICVPAMGPAPIALDFAFPVAWNPGDESELFSFFVGFNR